MSHFRFCVLTALLSAVATGCDTPNPTPPSDGAGGQSTETAGDASTAEGDPQPVRASDRPPQGAATAGSAKVTLEESATLKLAMIDVAADLIEEQPPNADPDTARDQVESAITQIRRDIPDFLMVSAETEQMLQAGNPVESAARRIAEAEDFLSEYGLPLSSLIRSLLTQHEAGELDHVRTELLAHLIASVMRKAQGALTN